MKKMLIIYKSDHLTVTHKVFLLKETPKTVKIQYDDQWRQERTLKKENILSLTEL